jgi:hypothetical protein
MIGLGTILEVFFYVARFQQDGTSLLLSLLIAAALSLLMALGVYNKWLWLVLSVGVYSVFSTSAGQTFSLLARENIVASPTSMLQSSFQNDTSRLDKEAEKLNKDMESVSTVEEQAKYRTTLQQMRQRLASIQEAKERLVEQEKASNKESFEAKKEAIKATNIYEFYASMGQWHLVEWLKFILHSVLSTFIAIMVPIGIITWPKKAPKWVIPK